MLDQQIQAVVGISPKAGCTIANRVASHRVGSKKSASIFCDFVHRQRPEGIDRNITRQVQPVMPASLQQCPFAILFCRNIAGLEFYREISDQALVRPAKVGLQDSPKFGTSGGSP